MAKAIGSFFGNIFGGGRTTVVSPPPPATRDDEAVRAARREEQQAARRRRGRGATIISGLGDQAEPNVRRPTLGPSAKAGSRDRFIIHAIGHDHRDQ